MRAARIHAYGPPSAIELEAIEPPIAGPGEVLVRVAAAGVTHWDARVRSGRSGLALSLPLTLGAEIAGTIESMEEAEAPRFAPGEYVYGSPNALLIGGYARYAVCSSDMLAPTPQGLSCTEAASLPVAAAMAWQMVVDHAQVGTGQTVVVLGAAGNVGAGAVQIALSRGAQVIGTVHRERDEERARALGVAQLLRSEDDFWRLAGTVDAVVDTVGGRSQDSLFPLLRRGGILVSSVSKPDAALAASRQVRGDYFSVRVTATTLLEIRKLIEAGHLRTQVGTVLPLDETRIAHEMLEGMRPRPGGKIVLSLE